MPFQEFPVSKALDVLQLHGMDTLIATVDGVADAESWVMRVGGFLWRAHEMDTPIATVDGVVDAEGWVMRVGGFLWRPPGDVMNLREVGWFQFMPSCKQLEEWAVPVQGGGQLVPVDSTQSELLAVAKGMDLAMEVGGAGIIFVRSDNSGTVSMVMRILKNLSAGVADVDPLKGIKRKTVLKYHTYLGMIVDSIRLIGSDAVKIGWLPGSDNRVADRLGRMLCEPTEVMNTTGHNMPEDAHAFMLYQI